MRKFFGIIVLFLALSIMGVPSKAQTIREVPIVKVADLGTSNGGILTKLDVSGDFKRETTKNSYMWHFKLDKPSFVRITATADVYKYNYSGDMLLYLEGNKIMDYYANGKAKSFDTLLEAGDYYIRQDVVQKSNDEKSIKASPYITILIEAQEVVKRTGSKTGETKESAINLKNGKTSYGIISGKTSIGTFPSNSIGQQYFKVTVKGKTVLRYKVAFKRYGNLGFLHGKVLKIQDNLGVNLVDKKDYKGNSITGSVTLPKAGTYYIVVSSERFASVGVSLSWSEKLNNLALKVNKIKKGARKVTGKSTKGSSIKVKIRTSTYKGRVFENGKFFIKTKPLKKGMRVAITVYKNGYKTKTVTVKVK